MARGNVLGSCLVCSTSCNLNTGCEISSDKDSLGFKENPLTLLSKILKKDIKEKKDSSQLVCQKCFKLLQDFDNLENKVSEIKHVILDMRRGTLKDKKEDEKEKKNKFSGEPSIKVEKDVDQSLTESNSVQEEKRDEAVKLYNHLTGQDGLKGDILDPEVANSQDYVSDDNIHESFKLASSESIVNGFEILQTVSSKTLPADTEHELGFASSSVTETENRTFMCLFCEDGETVLGDAELITNHVKDVHGIELYICEVCGQIFQNPDSFSSHLDEHLASDDGDFQCEICNRIFNNREMFYHHKTTHVGEKKKSARNIPELLKKPASVEKTLIPNPVEIQTKLYTCDLCSKTFLNEQNFVEHIQTHIKDEHNSEVLSVVNSVYKPFVCGKCGKSFARKAEIRDHERIHTGEKPYQCELCGRTFSQRSNLQSHKRAAHFDDRRYVCEECGKGFKRKRLLDYHLKSAHTGERPYKCEDCHATFVYPEHFKKHRRIHTGEKPYHCEVCGKAFNCRDNRNAHRFVHSDKKPYECSVCGAGYMRKPLLYQHMQSRGHVNDTIILNTPRLITDDNQCITWNEDGSVEIVAIDSLVAGSDEDNRVSEDISEALEEENLNENQMCNYLVEGDFEEISADVLADGDIQTIETQDGQYQLIKVKIPNEDGEDEETWIKIEPE